MRNWWESYWWSFTFTEDVGNKCFRAFVLGRLVDGKKSFFELTCKTRLKSATEKKKKILKYLLVAKEDCQAFGLLGNKEEKICCSIPISNVLLAVATPESTQC